MTKRFADLHLHSTLSDSTFTPEEVIERARKAGLSAVAITDHDCVDAIEPALKIAKLYSIELIPAVELSSENKEDEVHILGYFIDWRDKWLLDKLDKMRICRIERVKKIVEKLKNHDIDINIDEIFALSGCGSVGRLHIAQIMLKRGFVPDIKEAFRKYIGNNAPCYVSKFKLSPAEAIKIVHRAGGIAILAHPVVLKGESVLCSVINDGINGIEVYHPDHSHADTIYFLKFAASHKLLVTGGSDCHGFGKERVLIGSVKIPYELVDRLKDAVKRRY